METRYQAALDGLPISSVSPDIRLVDVAEAATVYRPGEVRKPGGGCFPQPALRESLTVSLTLWVRQRATAERQRTVDQLLRWAQGRRLTLSTRPGLFLQVRLREPLPTLSALRWADALTLRFTAWAVPWWQSETPSAADLAGERAAGCLYLPGTAASLASAEFRAVDGGVNQLSLLVNQRQMTFAGLKLAAGERLLVHHLPDGLQRLQLWRQDGTVEAAAACRTADSADVWPVQPGENALLLAADGPVAVKVQARGRWL